MADASSSSAPAAAEPVLRFRNYKPHSEEVQGAAVSIEKPALPDVEVIVNQTEVVHEDATQEPLLNLAPKRSANYDLKRDIEPQMKKLRAMTDRAIIHLIRQRVAEQEGGGEEGGANLSAAVAQQERLDNDED